MSKLKLQMQISLDGFVATTDSKPVISNWNDELRKYSITNLERVDYILLGSKTALDFIPFWAGVAANPNDPDRQLGKLLTDIPKIIFSKKITKSTLANAKMENGDLVDEIKKLKKENGNDIIVYGGVDFVSSLISNQLIDEYHLLVRPAALGSGMPIFKQTTNLELIKATPFSGGTVILKYEPAKK
ncbi:MAG TPA: dihydrofolate reductase family protein [Flavipsychrobacter sp.]|nr:dihydrofolate reductase family protein [Flavipsychrobacter sp.]